MTASFHHRNNQVPRGFSLGSHTPHRSWGFSPWGMLSCVLGLILLAPTSLQAQHKKPDAPNRATLLHTANVYVSANADSPPILTIAPGHEIIIDARNGAWLDIFANTETPEDADPNSKPEFTEPVHANAPSAGWIRDKGVVGPSTPNGDTLLFGAAAESEAQAQQPHAPAGAAETAHLLYRRLLDYFPDSRYAPQAAFRAADLRWQLEKADIATLPSAHEQDAYLRPQIYEGDLKQVIKYFPNTPEEALAAYDLLDNKLCGDWQGLTRCPEQETQLYLKYAARYPHGPKSAEALYNAAFRQASVVAMYLANDDHHAADQAIKNTQSLADQLSHDFPASAYAPRAQALAFKLRQGIPITGNDRD